MASASCPRDIDINQVTGILDTNDEGVVSRNIKTGMTLRSGRELPPFTEPPAKRLMRGGKKYKHKGGAAKDIVLNGLASILAASTLVGAGAGAWCYVGPSVNAFLIGCYTNGLLPKCATTSTTIMGWDTGINFKRALSTAYSYISKKDECQNIDWQHNLANDFINFKLAQIIAIMGAAGLSSYSTLKSFWLIILNACINVTSKSVGAVSSSAGFLGSYVKNLFSSKASVAAEEESDEPTSLDPLVVNIDFLEKITNEISKAEDPEVTKLLTLVAEKLEEQQASAIGETSPKASERAKTPEASELVPNSAPATREASPGPGEMEGGRKHRRTVKRSKSKRSKSKRSKSKRSKSKHSKSNKRSKSKRKTNKRSKSKRK